MDLVTAARLFEPRDPALARLTYLETLHAAIWMSGAGDFTIAKNVAAAIPTTLEHGRPRSGTDALVGHMLRASGPRCSRGTPRPSGRCGARSTCC